MKNDHPHATGARTHERIGATPANRDVAEPPATPPVSEQRRRRSSVFYRRYEQNRKNPNEKHSPDGRNATVVYTTDIKYFQNKKRTSFYAHSSILNQCRGLLIHRTGSRLCCGEVPSFDRCFIYLQNIRNNKPPPHRRGALALFGGLSVTHHHSNIIKSNQIKRDGFSSSGTWGTPSLPPPTGPTFGTSPAWDRAR